MAATWAADASVGPTNWAKTDFANDKYGLQGEYILAWAKDHPEVIAEWKKANPDAQEAALRGGLIGSPDTIRKKLARFETSHIDQVILLNQAGKNAHEDICESLELFGCEVMPEFQAHHAGHLKWKEKVMAREIELEEIETAAFKDRFGKAMPAQLRNPKAATT